MFTDLVGSTAIGERLDPEALRRVMDRYFETAREAIERHGGLVEKFIGDAVMAVFGVPLAHEDDPLRAVRAAIDLREGIEGLSAELAQTVGERLEIRTGICTGEVLAGMSAQTERIVTGDAVNVAARLEQAAGPGQILLGSVTYASVREAVDAEPVPPLDLKGKAEAAAAWRLLDVRTGAEPVPRRPDSPFVGRAGELEVLTKALECARATRSPQLVTILGEPGVGKTRLAAEAVTRMQPEALVLRGRVHAYGERIELRPLVEMLEGLGPDGTRRHLAGTTGGERAADILAGLLQPADGVADIEEVPAAVRLLFEAIGRGRPLVLVIDDVQWAEPPMLDVIEHLALRARDTVLLLICIARSELLDAMPELARLAPGSTPISLNPLEDGESETIVANLLGGMPTDPAFVTRVAETCEGNPLFLEQFVGSLLDDGSLQRRDDAWVATRDLRDLPTPATVSALLEARLERLPGPERAILERGAIEGMRFHDGFLRAIVPEPERPALDRHLHALMRRGLLHPDEPLLPGHDAFRFGHVLVHDAAYARLPKELRAELHERYADWLATAVGPSAVGTEETFGWHLEQAYRLRVALGLADEHATELGLRGGAMLERAGRREEDRGNHGGAYDLFRRASDLPARTEVERGHRLLDASANGRHVPRAIDGAFCRILELIERARGIALATGDTSLAVRARAQWSEVAGTVAERELPYDRVEEAAWLGRALADPSLDPRARDEARWALWMLRLDDGNVEAMYALTEAMMDDAARRGTVRRRRRAVLAWLTSAWTGRRDVPRDLDSIRSLFDVWADDPATSARLAATEALLLGVAGRDEEARTAYARWLSFQPELRDRGIVRDESGDDPQLDAELAEARGDLEGAIGSWRAVVRRVDEIHASGYASSYRLYLARALLRRGEPEDLEEADRLIARAAQEHVSGDMVNEILLPECRSLLAGGRADATTAEREARLGVVAADATGWLWAQGDARIALALALLLAGRDDEAEAAEREAIARYERSGSTALADRARSYVAEARVRRGSEAPTRS
jgi:class 3 adenylate cyclase